MTQALPTHVPGNCGAEAGLPRRSCPRALRPQNPAPRACIPRALRAQNPAPATQPARWAPPCWSEARPGGAHPRCPRPRRVCGGAGGPSQACPSPPAPDLSLLPGYFQTLDPASSRPGAGGAAGGTWRVGGAPRRGPRGPRDQGCAPASPRPPAPPPPALMGGPGAGARLGL